MIDAHEEPTVTTQTPVRPTPEERSTAASWAPLLRVVTGPVAVRRWAVAALAINVVIVVTGGLVRLTASGLGCPTWPRCSENSFVSHPELGVHGAIEFGNRLLTFVLIVVVALTWIAALRFRDAARADIAAGGRRRDVRWLAGGLLLGIPAQIVIGGISVLTHLNPWVVGLHFVVSMALVGLATGLVRVSRGDPPLGVGRRRVLLARVAFVGMVLAVWLGTVVTGSGPHAGDLNAVRNGLDGGTVAHLHAAAVWVTIGATVGLLFFARAGRSSCCSPSRSCRPSSGWRSTTWASPSRSSRCTCWVPRSPSPRRRTCCSPSGVAPFPDGRRRVDRTVWRRAGPAG